MAKKYINGRTVEMDEAEIEGIKKEHRLYAIRERSRHLTTEEVLAKIIPQTINTVEVDDDTALRMVEFYPEWAAGVAYAVGFKVQRNGKLWRVLQGHTSQAGWEPENAASLWTEICETHDGTEDDPIPYSGNMALENGKYYIQNNVVYVCTRDTINPVYNPLSELIDLYVVLEDDYDQNTDRPLPEWEQPNSTNPYQIGDVVTHNGKIWESIAANNVWEPGVYGWIEVDD